MLKTIEWSEGLIRILDQSRLPWEVKIIECKTAEELAEAIRTMKIRGAPAIGLAAALGLAQAAYQSQAVNFEEFWQILHKTAQILRSTRPTAVNLFWGLERVMNLIKEGGSIAELRQKIIQEALKIAKEDEEINRKLSAYGAELVPEKANILTHCNAGALATGGYGTALGVIKHAFGQGKQLKVFVDETRPLFQGARLTTWELMQEKIPTTLIADNMAGYLMSKRMIDLVIVGADRIVRNGDVANKIGTYTLAVLAKENQVPFYVAAPLSTFDFNLASGEEIVIEERNPEEITNVYGVKIAPEGVEVLNPAFDVTPNRLVTAIVTEKGILQKPFEENIARLKV